MLEGLLRPLASSLPLHKVLACAGPGEMLGAWVSDSPEPRRIRIAGNGGSLLLSPDLGFLLKCRRVVLRAGVESVALAADTIIRWRALQVATATPYLPGLPGLQRLFPGLRVTPEGFLVPVGRRSPEEVLAACVNHGVRVSGSQVVYLGDMPQPGTNVRREFR